MTSNCRLCGHKKAESEFVTTLNRETENVSFFELIQYFCRIELDPNPLLSQNVCRTCKVSLESFMLFCDHLERHQQILKQAPRPKKENKTECIVIQDVEEKSAEEQNPALILNDYAAYVGNATAGISDEDIDSPMSTNQTEDTVSLVNGYAESFTSTSDSTTHFNLRKKPTPSTLNCSVALEILDLIYIKSETESDSETESNFEVAKNIRTSKRQRNSVDNVLEGNISLAKRMRFNSFVDFKPKAEPNTEDGNESLPSSSSVDNNFMNYLKLFQTELKLDYSESKFNLEVALPAKASDGSIVGDYVEGFFPWSSMELNCLSRNCSNKPMSPYELMVHNQNSHRNQSETFIKCSICPSSQLAVFNFTNFIQHVTDNHYEHLRYCCLICSKMFYNFTALFHHYQTFHPIFSGTHICLYEGQLFEDFAGLEHHVASHDHTMELKTLKTEKVEGADDVTGINDKNLTNGNAKGFNCEICGSNFRSVFNFECHQKTHKRQFSCDQEFSSNYSLTVHKNEHRQDSNSNFEI